MNARKITAVDIECALYLRYRKNANGYWPQIEVREPNGDLLRLDGVSFSIDWKGDMWFSGFEVKTSRSDFLRDAKYQRYKDYVDDLTLVCPARMIDRQEIPEPIGLMWYEPDAKPGRPRLRYRRKPSPSHGDTRQIERRLLKQIAWQALGHDKPNRYGHYDSARRYLEERDEMKNIGRALGTKMAVRLQQLEQAQEPTHARTTAMKADMFDRLVRILNRHGYDQITPWQHDGYSQAITDLDHALDATAPLEQVDHATLDMIHEIERLRERLGIDNRKGTR